MGAEIKNMTTTEIWDFDERMEYDKRQDSWVEKRDVPVEGNGATVIYYSDRKACTVLWVRKGVACLQRDKVTRLDNNGAMNWGQMYAYQTDEDGELFYFKQDKKGNWRHAIETAPGRYRMEKGVSVWWGIRGEFYDFEF